MGRSRSKCHKIICQGHENYIGFLNLNAMSPQGQSNSCRDTVLEHFYRVTEKQTCGQYNYNVRKLNRNRYNTDHWLYELNAHRACYMYYIHSMLVINLKYTSHKYELYLFMHVTCILYVPQYKFQCTLLY